MSELESNDVDESSHDESTSVLSIDVGGTLLGVPVAHVLEIDETPIVTAVPMAPPHILGLINWRGRPLPLVSLERFAGLSTNRSESADVRRMIILRAASMTVALQCDRVRGVEHLPKSSTDVSLAVGHGLEGFVTTQVDRGDEVMLVFDVSAFFEASRMRA